MKLQGIFIPVAVPFDHAGELYQVKVQHNIEKWNRASVSGYVVPGPESRYLSSNEKTHLWDLVAKYSTADRLRIAQVEAPSVHEAVSLANCAAEQGYRAVVLGSVAEPQDAQLIYVRAVADRSKIPIIIVPLNERFAEVANEHPNIFGLLGGAMIGTVREKHGPKLQLINGADSAIAQGFESGASAAFVSFANAAPYAAISIWEAHRTRESEAALDWQKRIATAVQLIETYGPAGLKHAMDLNGYYGGLPRLPLVGLTPEAKKAIEEALDGIKG
jgi:4-hydroxy-2-oxoglutarate aldolase